ncbi:ABC transporter ATP-binding protein [Ramlibacter sp.]|uniref:ABC transporter ATP-binding protein n=1 Tax=Ramlibacter sp. TaxID=1917967 RepID=UPI001851EF12|nr:ABC transporter ATP-binding protein [Ramlibacter sp.]MBA2672222.1 ABC transporter ATP-binding protein [Ramlibacter sp.]
MQTGTNKDFLSLVGVGKRYGATRVLEDFNLSIAKNEFITLLGPSGCGKTTTLRMIAGFVQPTEGEILLQGQSLSSASVHVPPERRNIGMVFQSYAVWPHMSVRENIQLPLRLRKMSGAEVRKRTDEVLELCRLTTWADRSPHQLSGGQLQRVALARALAYRPALVLLDEPLSNLDVALREELRAELQLLHRAIESTFVLVTHDQVEAMSLSDRVVVMCDGRIEQVGAPHEIYQSPATEFVANFVGAANVLAAEVVAVHGGTCEVRVGALPLHMRARPGVGVGDTVSLAIHPEAVQLGGDGSGGSGREANRFTARVLRSSFLGRTHEMLLDVQGVQLRAVALRGQLPAEGANVAVSIAADAIVAIGRDTGGALAANEEPMAQPAQRQVPQPIAA